MTQGNLSENMLIPAALRRNYIKLYEEYDKLWEPLFLEMMPKVVGEGNGSKHYFTRPRIADPQVMAKFYEEMEAIEPLNTAHARFWSYNTRTMGAGFRRGKRMFAGDFEGGIIQRAHAQQLENLSKSMNRLLEFTLCKFVYGDTDVMTQFTTQDVNRQAVVRLDTGEFNGTVDSSLDGKRWDDFSGGASDHPEVFKDIAYMVERFEYINGNSPSTLIIGRKTGLALELNEHLLERLIRVKDTTDGVLGTTIQGLKIKKVTGQTYKEIPGISTLAEGYPGKGDFLEMDWNRENRHDMMTESMGAQTVEWGVLTDNDAGEISCGWVDEDHKAMGTPTQVFLEQWEERNPKQVWTTGKLEVCPVIKDYAKLILIRGMARQ